VPPLHNVLRENFKIAQRNGLKRFFLCSILGREASLRVGVWEHTVAKGLCVMQNGQVLVEYGKRRVSISPAQYRANGYKPPCDRLPAEAPPKAREEFAPKANSATPTYLPHDRNTSGRHLVPPRRYA
jgi:hypothetical protein